MSLLDRLDVPAAQSRASTIATDRPRDTASSATPAPTMPPPMTSTSNSFSAMVRSAAVRYRGPRGAGVTFRLLMRSADDRAGGQPPCRPAAPARSVDVDPVERPLDRLLPAG